jgi:CheY-like chemotaxis protein
VFNLKKARAVDSGLGYKGGIMDKKRILVVEDDLYNRDLTKEVLEGAGLIVDTAEDGIAALEKIKQGGFDLILLDAMMPNIDGLTVLTQMKTFTPQTPNGPVYLFTNLAGDAIIYQAKNLGAAGCLIKTELNPDQLIEKVKGLISSAE